MSEAKEALVKALASVDEFLKLHGAGEGEYAVGPHYGFTMKSVDQVGGVCSGWAFSAMRRIALLQLFVWQRAHGAGWCGVSG